MGCRRNEVESRVLLAQKLFRGAAKPILKYGRIKRAEVHLVFEVAIVEIIEGRVFACESALRLCAGQEHARRSPMIGALARVLAHAPTKLGEYQHEDLVGETLALHVCLKQSKRRCQLVEPGRLRVKLTRMRVVAALGRVQHANAKIG